MKILSFYCLPFLGSLLGNGLPKIVKEGLSNDRQLGEYTFRNNSMKLIALYIPFFMYTRGPVAALAANIPF